MHSEMVEPESVSLAIGMYSTKFETEAEETDAAHTEHSTDTYISIISFTDVLSLLLASRQQKDKELYNLLSSLIPLL